MSVLKTCFTAAVLLLCQGANAAFYNDLAYHHAPVHYQDTDSTNYPAEYITAVDYDYDMISNNADITQEICREDIRINWI